MSFCWEKRDLSMVYVYKKAVFGWISSGKYGDHKNELSDMQSNFECST